MFVLEKQAKKGLGLYLVSCTLLGVMTCSSSDLLPPAWKATLSPALLGILTIFFYSLYFPSLCTTFFVCLIPVNILTVVLQQELIFLASTSEPPWSRTRQLLMFAADKSVVLAAEISAAFSVIPFHDQTLYWSRCRMFALWWWWYPLAEESGFLTPLTISAVGPPSLSMSVEDQPSSGAAEPL